jgi:diaminopimelate decarboxylase
LPELCVGGGLGVAYVEGDVAPSIDDSAGVVRTGCKSSGIPGSVRLSAEPGRAIAATAAITCYEIGTIKEVPGIRTYVSVDGGMSDNPRPALYHCRYEAFLPRETSAPRPLEVTIAGKHCESGDIVVKTAACPSTWPLATSSPRR